MGHFIRSSITSFSAAQIGILDLSLDTQISVIKRRINAERSDDIRALLEKQLLDVQEVKVLVNNPKLISKCGSIPLHPY